MSLEGEKIVSAQEAVRVEKTAIARGAKDINFMECAGASIAEAVRVNSEKGTKRVALVVGKGNNGGDAYAAGNCLLEQGFSVTAWALYPPKECSPLSQAMLERFVGKGGALTDVCPALEEGIILDGIFGTGFSGKLDAKIAEAIKCVNRAKIPIFAIDIPSGVNGNTGEVADVAVCADVTLALEFYKTGFFFGQGWDHIGSLQCLSYGLEAKDKEAAVPDAHIFAVERLGALLPPIKRSRHKYESGYVLGVAGSLTMPGAALLSSFGALRSGAGIMRLFTREEALAACAHMPPEIIREAFSSERFQKELQRARSVFLGPGLGRSSAAQELVENVLQMTRLPIVIDADALRFITSSPLPEKCVLTPQHAEMEALASIKQEVLKNAQACAEEKKCTILLKGGPSWVFHPGTKPLLIAQGTPALATAGTGDVLTGVLAALLAQGLEPRTAAAVGAAWHGLAGECAAAELSPYSVVASDLFTFLPKVIANCL